MANIFRLALIGALFSLLFALNASAAAPVIKWGFAGPGYYEPRTWLAASFASETSACEAGIAALQAKGHGGRLQAGDVVYAESNVCFFYRPGAGGVGPLGDVFKEMSCGNGEKLEGGQCVPDPNSQCSANSERVDGVCVCKAGFKQSAGDCIADPDAACKGLVDWCSNQKGFRTDFEGRGEGADFFCHAAENFIAGAGGGGSSWETAFPGCNKGCMISSGSLSISAKDDNGQWWTRGNGKYVGSTCDPNVINKLNEGTPEEKEVKPTDTKKPGKCNGQQGTYNGVVVCLPYNEVKGDEKTKTENNSDGTKKETTTKTTCTFSQCSTETKVVDKDKNGNTTNTNTSVVNVSKDEYCARNAGSAVCKGLNPDDKSGSGGSGGGGGGGGGGGKGDGDDDEEEKDKGSFAGSCQAGFKCEGDALQCAIAHEQHKRSCELFVNESDESRLYKAEVAKGRDRDVTKDLPGNREIDVSGKLSKDDLLGGARCISDLKVTVWGTDVSLPLSKICPGLEYMGWVLVAVSSLAAFRIVSGSTKD